MIKFIILLIVVFLIPVWADASPGQSGSSGLLNLSSAETLDAGNICVGIWPCYSENKSFSKKSSLIMPVTFTMGIGTFWEVYGAYPNALFNGDDEVSGRGTLDLGTKLRFLGGRSSAFKVAVDLLGQHHVSESRKINGVTDLSAALVASYNPNDFGIHVTAGYLKPGAVSGITLEAEYIFGAGVEYMAMPRLKLLSEVTSGTNRYYIEDHRDWVSPRILTAYSIEASVGVQYYLSPYITLNTSLGTGLGPNDPGIKLLFGISSCLGAGTYAKPITSVGRHAEVNDKINETLNPLKAFPISSMMLNSITPQSAPASKFEIELRVEKEDILIKPYGRIAIAPQQASSNLTSPVISEEIQLIAREEEITLQPLIAEYHESSAIDYTLDRVRGITPLCGVDVKGSQVTSHTATAIPERMTVYRKFRFPDVIFDYDQSTLSNSGKKMLSEFAEQIRNDKQWLYININGHTDSIGSPSYNKDLSLNSALAVASYLVGHEGLSHTNIFIKGLGNSSPIAENNTAVGRNNNRRTEILLLISKEGQ